MAGNFVIEKFAVRMLGRALLALLLLAALAYPIDFAIWRTRLALSKDGRGVLGTVQVYHVVAAGLKGNKEEYYGDGTSPVDCSKSLFPQGGDNACWWVVRHPEVIDHY
jgi:hypothetical protein